MTQSKKKRRITIPGVQVSPLQVLLRALLGCLVIGIAFFGVALRRIEKLPLTGDPLLFDGKVAHQYMSDLAKKFPNRLPWDKSRIDAGNWLKRTLAEFGYQPQEMVFSSVIAGKSYSNLRNIYAEKKGSTHPEEIIVVSAHYDTAEGTYEGAMDDASGVGVVLELARIFKDYDNRRTLLFLLTDSEEFGAFWGARTFAKQFERANQIIGVANFDFVSSLEQVTIISIHDGLKRGYTPLWLRELGMDSLRAIDGFYADETLNFIEFFQRALLIPPADHGAFLSAGIPAFTWVGQNADFAGQMAHHHHTENDTVEIMEVESFKEYGSAAEKFVRSLDQLHRIPENYRDSDYWKITRNLYLDGWAVTLLHILAFIPFILYSVAKFGVIFQKYPPEVIRGATLNEAKNLGILVGSLLIGYALIRLLPDLNVIDKYELFPATQKSKILYNPDFLAILLIFFSVGLVFFLFRKVFGEIKDENSFTDIRHGFYAVFLSLIILVGFFGNTYLTTLLLLPPAYMWTAINSEKRSPGRADRILNGLLLTGGVITLIIGAVVLRSIFHVGVVYWYAFLSIAYGLFSVYTVVVAILVLAIMIRLFRSFVLR